MTKIYVVDSMMGSGKSTYCYEIMFNNVNKKYIYVTPYLNEIERVIGEKENRTKFYDQRGFREPIHLEEGKLEGLHSLLIKDYNIVTTHALFRKSIAETIDLIASGEYILMLDEALDIVDIFDINIKDYDMLLNNHLIEVDDNRVIKWLDNKYEGKFVDLKRLCQNGNVIKLKKTNRVQLLAWTFNPELFKAFKEVYIFTYLFESSYMKYYFDMYHIEYDKLTIENYKMIPFEDKTPYNKQNIKYLMNIYDGNLNNIGDKQNALSLNWFKNNISLRSKLKNNMYNYFHNILDSKSIETIWTTFKSKQKYLNGKGYTRRFISLNTRATNKYKDCYNLAYCCNRYMSPDYIDFFRTYNVNVDEELFALSELLQWIWRSAIRMNKPINIYIPSSRMRMLLIDWLNNSDI